MQLFLPNFFIKKRDKNSLNGYLFENKIRKYAFAYENTKLL